MLSPSDARRATRNYRSEFGLPGLLDSVNCGRYGCDEESRTRSWADAEKSRSGARAITKVSFLAPQQSFLRTQPLNFRFPLTIAMVADNSQRPSDEMFNFSLLGSAAAVLAPRLGRLSIAGRKPISTPNYVPLTSRGAVPHLAHDVMQDNTLIESLFIGLEDCTYRAHAKKWDCMALTTNAHRGSDISLRERV
jgi:hypothetical protein